MAKLSEPVTGLDHARGPDKAPVTIVEYGDYECASSGFAHYAVRQLMQDYPDSIRLVFRNFPLTQIRPNALPAALAAEAADPQGKFWEMHDTLFEYQEALEPEDLLAYAQLLGLDLEKFIVDMTSDRTIARIRQDFVGGIKSGVEITPAFFVNGKRHDGPYDYDILRAVMESELKAARRRRKRGNSKTVPAQRGR